MSMTCLWLIQDLLLAHDLFLTCSWIVCYFSMTWPWVVHNLIAILTWLVHDLSSPFWHILHNMFMTCTSLNFITWITSLALPDLIFISLFIPLFSPCLAHDMFISCYWLFATCSWTTSLNYFNWPTLCWFLHMNYFN